MQEGAIQLYKNYQTGEYMLGAVGQLQFEVFKHRMEGEYNAEVVMSPMGKKTVRWIKPEDFGRAHVLKPQYLGQGPF